jgi:hypothetical protein
MVVAVLAEFTLTVLKYRQLPDLAEVARAANQLV